LGSDDEEMIYSEVDENLGDNLAESGSEDIPMDEDESDSD